MDRQEVFNKVSAHLLLQGARATRDGETCRYRTSEGLTCAIGCLIPEDKYDPTIEGACPVHLGDASRIANSTAENCLRRILVSEIGEITPDDARFLDGLRGIHDSCAPHTWEENLEQFARNYKLEFSDG